MASAADEWLKQADYDLDTAEFMLKGCRNMGKETALAAIDRFRADLVRRGVQVASLVLFGSYAKGTQHEWSDIDLVVVSADFLGMGLWQRIQLVSPAILAAHAPIEPIILTPEEWADQNRLICQIARQDSEVVYSDGLNVN